MDTKTLTEALSQRTHLGTDEIGRMLDDFSAIVKEHCCEMDTVSIPGFGSLEPRKRAERVTTHPVTGKRLLVPPKITVRFKQSALLKQKMK